MYVAASVTITTSGDQPLKWYVNSASAGFSGVAPV